MDYIAFVQVSIPISLTFDDETTTQREMEEAALENFIEHPALKNAHDLSLYVDALRIEKTGEQEIRQMKPKWTHDDAQAALAQGWLLANNVDEGRNEIQRYDEAEVFSGDEEARSFVVEQAAKGGALAAKALLLETKIV